MIETRLDGNEKSLQSVRAQSEKPIDSGGFGGHLSAIKVSANGNLRRAANANIG
ncbi:MAG: hypothetical protein ACXU8O_04875 [Asticcacaulis sp.]